MTDTHPLAKIGKGIFRGIPAPLLVLISMTLAVVLGIDLLLPDALPLLDEAVLAFLLYGSMSSLLGSRGKRDTRAVTEAVPVSRLMKEADGAARQLAALARKLRKGGLPVPALDGLSRVRTETSRLTDELRVADAFLSRKENDPWQVQRETERLEKAVAEAEAGGEHQRQSSLQIALEGARMHSRRVAKQSADRDRAVSILRSRTGQLQTLAATLTVIDKQGDIPNLPDGLETGWEPELAAAVDGLREVAVATAELEGVSETEARSAQGRSRSSNTA